MIRAEPPTAEQSIGSDGSISIDVEVRYAETDQMRVVHHAVYPVWFELARTRLCERTGHRYAEIEATGYLLMVTGLDIEFRQSARYGDTVSIECRLDDLRSRTLRFGYRVHRDGQLLARGTTSHVWLETKTSRPCRIPEFLAAPFARLLTPPLPPDTSE